MHSRSELILKFFSETYDALVGTGCFCEGHVKSDCLPEMARVVKKGDNLQQLTYMYKTFLISKVLGTVHYLWAGSVEILLGHLFLACRR